MHVLFLPDSRNCFFIYLVYSTFVSTIFHFFCFYFTFISLWSRMFALIATRHFLQYRLVRFHCKPHLISLQYSIQKVLTKGGFLLGEMTSNFAEKSRRNYFAAKLYLIFTWITLTRLLKTFWKTRLLLLKMLYQTMIKLRIKINKWSSF